MSFSKSDILKDLKMLLYFVVLVVAMLFLKALSEMEFSMRDQSVTYADVLVEGFDDNERRISLGNTSKVDKTGEPGNLHIDFSFAESEAMIPVLNKPKIEKLDTGYIECKYKLMAPAATLINLARVDGKGVSVGLGKFESDSTEYHTLTSAEFPFADCHKVVLMLNNSETFDPLQGEVLLDYVKFVKRVTPQKIF